MIKIHDGQVWVKSDYLSNHGISCKSIKSRLNDFRKGKTRNWRNIPHPKDKRVKLIQYSTIPENTRSYYKLPTEERLKTEYAIKQQLRKEAEQKALADRELQKIKLVLDDAYENLYLKYVSQYHHALNLNREKVFSYSRLHAVITSIIALQDENVNLSTLHHLYLEFDFGKINKISSYKAFSAKLNECRKNGIRDTLLHGRLGLKLKTKLNDFIIGKIEQYLCDTRQFSHEQITEYVNLEIKTYNDTPDGKKRPFQLISKSTVSAYARIPEVRNTILLHRNKSKFNKIVQPSSRRKTAIFAGDTYQMDGTKIQFLTWNEKKKKVERLSIFAIRDVKSGKIMGFDLAESEDKYNVLNSIEMAVKSAGLLPYEWVYDNASASKTEEFKSLKLRLEIHGSRVRHAKVGNSQDKSQLERWFRTYQNRYQRMIPGFLGGGITSKVDTERIDPDYLARIRKEIGIPSKEQIHKHITALIAIYNSTPGNGGKTPNQIFTACTKDNAVKIGAEQIAFLFWHSKKIKVRNMEIETEIRKQKYYYELSFNNKRFDLNGKTVQVFYDHRDLSHIHVFDLKENYIGEFKQKIAPYLSTANQTDEDKQQIIKNASHYNSIKNAANKRLKDIARKAVSQVGEETFYRTINPFAAGKELINDAESQVFLDLVQNMTGIDFDKIEDIPDVIPDTPLHNKDFEVQDHCENLYTARGSLEEIVEEVNTQNPG